MTKMKALSAVIILSAAIAAPVLAQGTTGPGYGLKLQPVTNYRSNYRVPDDQDSRETYSRSNATFYAQPPTRGESRNVEDFGFSGRDASRASSEDPCLHSAG